MRTITKIVLVIIIITLVYSVVKLINASAPQEQTIATITWPVNQPTNNTQNNQATLSQNEQQNTTQNATPNTQSQSSKTVYQADEILIDGQGQAGQNYIDITSDTPITPQQAQAQNTQNNNGGAYAEASVSINNNQAQNYAPGMPASEVLNGN